MRATATARTESVQRAPETILMRSVPDSESPKPAGGKPAGGKPDGGKPAGEVALIEPYEAFDTYYKREYRQLLGLAYVLTGNSWVAEDLVQEALTETHKRWDIISRYDQPGAWVRRVLVNRSTSRFRKLKSESKAVTRIGQRRPEVVQPTERQTEIWEIVSGLPARQAQVIALFYWDDLPIAEIALLLNCSVETVKTHLKRARTSLAAKLASHSEQQDSLGGSL